MCLKPENRTKEELAEQILKDTKELIEIAKESKLKENLYEYELIKLNSKIEGSNVKIKEQSGERKDRYSSLGYSYMVARQIEVDYKPKNTDFDPSKFVMSKQSKTRIL